MKIFIVNGYPESGKDTFIDMCLEYLGNNGFKYSTVDVVKEYAKQIGWDGKKDDRGRELLSDLKKALEKYNNFSHINVREFIGRTLYTGAKNGESLDNYVFFIIAREPEQIKSFQKEYKNSKSILIKRDAVEKREYSNDADRKVELFTYDYTVYNTGTLKNLKEMAAKFLEETLKNWFL